MELSDRKKRILRAVVEKYVETAEPVGSKAIVNDCGLSVSSATVRNEMADLESLGLLEHPHTSSGRVPTAQGYRVYVNELMEEHRLSEHDTDTINRALRNNVQQLDKVLSDAGRLTSQLTNYPAYALAVSSQQPVITRFDLIHVDQHTFIIVVLLNNNTVKNKLVHLPVTVAPETLTKLSAVFNANFTGIPEEEMTPQLIAASERASGDTSGFVAVIAGFAIELLMTAKSRETFMTGASHLFEHPEFRDVDKAHRVLSYLSDENGLLKLPTPDQAGGSRITIGPENLAEELKDSSVVVAKYDAGDNLQGIIGVVGPTRMDYPKVAARLQYIANGLSWLLAGGFSLPGIDDKDS